MGSEQATASQTSTASVRTVLVGCGYIAQAEHLPGWCRAAGGSLVAVVDLDRASAKRVGAAHRVPAFVGLSEALRETSATAVHVCTPASTHADIIRGALKAGCHVLAEKPLTEDVTAAVGLVELARRLRLTLMVGAPRLYDPYLESVTEALSSGEFGDVSSIQSIWRMSRRPEYRRLTDASRHRAVTSTSGSVAWLRERLLDESIHHLGVLRRWTGGQLSPRGVFVTKRTFHIVLESPGGVLATHSHVSPAGHGETFTVYAARGRLEATAWSPHFPHVGGTLTVEPAGDAAVIHPPVVRDNPYWKQIQEFVDVVQGNASPRRSADHAVEDLKLIDAIVDLARGGAGGQFPAGTADP